MSKPSKPAISSNSSGAGMIDEPIYRRVGSVKASEGGKAINLHFFDGNKYFTIPLTDIKLILYEMEAGKTGTVGVIREYPTKSEGN